MNVINTIFKSKWGISKWLRLLIGSAFLMDAFYKSSGLVGVLGGFIVYQALFNMGCSSGNCNTETSSKHPHDLSHNFKNVNK